jgi:hypothetical protein
MTAPTPNAMPGAVAPPAQPPAPDAPPVVTPPVSEPPATPKPPWEQSGEEFNPERAWNLIQNKNRDLAELKARTDPIVEEHERLRRASQTDLDRAREDIAAAGEREKTWRDQAVRSKAEALAAGRFVDTETALALIGDISGYTNPDGIDIAKLTARLDQLAADKPFLVAAPPQPPGFTPNRAQGQSGTGGAVPVDQQIKAAQERGDFATSIALKQQRYHQTQNRS